jgi:hypothetical protein
MSAKPRLQAADFTRAAAALGVPVAAIQAVTEVEARSNGFGPTGEPVILFERHVFSRRTGGRFDKTHPDVSNAAPGGYGSYSDQHRRLQRASGLDRDAALESASWGLFQIMGYNHAAAGHETLQGFINAMYDSESEQLDSFVAFIKSNPRILAALKARDWATFARLYNGPAYKKNKYDTKLAAAYARHGGTS